MAEETPGVERRRYPRLDTSIQAVARSTQGARYAISIADLSAKGCGVISERHSLKVGSPYSIKVAGLETLDGIAAWSAGKLAGVEFCDPLHVAVVDHLGRQHPRLSGDEDA